MTETIGRRGDGYGTPSNAHLLLIPLACVTIAGLVGWASGEYLAMFAACVAVGATMLAVTYSGGLRTFLLQTVTDFEQDAGLLFAGNVEERAGQWLEHVDFYSELSQSGSSEPHSRGTRRINYLSVDRLGILERKFATLLQVQSLLGVIVGLSLGATLWIRVAQAVTGWHLGRLLFFLPPAAWLVTIVGCLLAIGNPVWGDMWKSRLVTSNGALTDDELAHAEKMYVDALVRLVVVRTAVLRGLTALALVNLWLVMLMFFCLVASVIGASSDVAINQPQVTTPYVHVQPVPPTSAYTFESGQVCSPGLSPWIEQVAGAAMQAGVTKGLAVGAADAMPLGPELRRVYGDNIDLAFARATCTAEGIKTFMSSMGVVASFEIRVRDRVEKGKSSSLDRNVSISWSR